MTLSSFESSLLLEVRHPEQTNGRVKGWLVVEREEGIHDGGVRFIRLHCLRILPEAEKWNGGRDVFSGAYSAAANAVSLTSAYMAEGDIHIGFLNLRGHWIGTYLMNEIVRWAQQWPKARINRIELAAVDGDDDNKERRNWLYEQFGISFDYIDTDHKAGYSRPLQVQDLNLVEVRKEVILEHSLPQYIAKLLIARQVMERELQESKNRCTSLTSKTKVKPFRWLSHTGVKLKRTGVESNFSTAYHRHVRG